MSFTVYLHRFQFVAVLLAVDHVLSDPVWVHSVAVKQVADMLFRDQQPPPERTDECKNGQCEQHAAPVPTTTNDTEANKRKNREATAMR